MPSYSAVRCRPFCLANASTSGVIVRVVADVRRITSLFSAASTSVLPHHPSPTMPALITCYSRNARRFRFSFCVLSRPRQHGQHDAAQHPEHAILDAADHPDPFFSHLVGGGTGD